MKFNPVIEHLKTYEPGKPIELVVREFGIDPADIVKLASNENPWGVQPQSQRGGGCRRPSDVSLPRRYDDGA